MTEPETFFRARVRLADIDIPEQFIDKRTYKELSRLIDNIDKNGLKQELALVKNQEDGRFLIYGGVRRLLAMRSLDKTECNCSYYVRATRVLAIQLVHKLRSMESNER